jgi:general stress protein 13
MEVVAEGNIVTGTVTKTKPFGALVELPGNLQGLVHISHISSAYVQNVDEYVSAGDVVRVKVLSVDTKTNKISLSIKEAASAVKPERTESRQNDYYRSPESQLSFEEKFKEYVKSSNERLAGLNKRNKKKLN